MRRKIYGLAVIVAGSAACFQLLAAGAFLSQGDWWHTWQRLKDGLLAGSIAGLIWALREYET